MNRNKPTRLIASLLAVSLTLAPVMAYAGAVTGQGFGPDRGAACAKAKQRATAQVPYGKSITSISSCECGDDGIKGSDVRWTCSAEVYYKD